MPAAFKGPFRFTRNEKAHLYMKRIETLENEWPGSAPDFTTVANEAEREKEISYLNPMGIHPQ